MLAASVAVAANLRVQGAAQIRDCGVQLLQRVRYLACLSVFRFMASSWACNTSLLGLKFRLQGGQDAG